MNPLRSRAKEFDEYYSGHELTVMRYHQLNWWQFLRIPAISNYGISGLVTKNGAMFSDGKHYYDPALYTKPIPPDITFREVAPDENEYYMIYIDCDGECPVEKQEQVYEQYGFLAMETMSPDKDRLFITVAYTSENTLLQAMENGDIYWYKRYDEVFWDRYQYEQDDEENTPVRISTYLPNEWSVEEQKREIRRIEELVREYGGQPYVNGEGDHDIINTVRIKDCEDYFTNRNILFTDDIIAKKKVYQTDLRYYIAPSFPTNKIWNLVQDQNIFYGTTIPMYHWVPRRNFQTCPL